jgi:hypothetical protein
MPNLTVCPLSSGWLRSLVIKCAQGGHSNLNPCKSATSLISARLYGTGYRRYTNLTELVRLSHVSKECQVSKGRTPLDADVRHSRVLTLFLYKLVEETIMNRP